MSLYGNKSKLSRSPRDGDFETDGYQFWWILKKIEEKKAKEKSLCKCSCTWLSLVTVLFQVM